MIDWLRSASETPTLALDERELPLAIKRHKQAKRMTLRLASDGSEVRVTIPTWTPTGEAIAFARSRQDWLAEQLTRIPENTPPAPGGTIRFHGEELKIRWNEARPRKPALRDGAVELGGPEDTLMRRLQRWLESEALTSCAADLEHYCQRADVPTPKIALSRAKRRWGSCSTSGTVRINWRLIQAPEHVRRSVVAHEVAHCVHFDHGPQFYALLDVIYEDDLPAADAWLKIHGRSLYASFG